MKFYDSGTVYGSGSPPIVMGFRYRFRVHAWLRVLYEILMNIRTEGVIDLVHTWRSWSVTIHKETEE